MTVILSQIWGEVLRPWGYEIRANYQDETGRIYNECLTFQSVPTETDLLEEVESLRQRLEAASAPEFTVENEDGSFTDV